MLCFRSMVERFWVMQNFLDQFQLLKIKVSIFGFNLHIFACLPANYKIYAHIWSFMLFSGTLTLPWNLFFHQPWPTCNGNLILGQKYNFPVDFLKLNLICFGHMLGLSNGWCAIAKWPAITMIPKSKCGTHVQHWNAAIEKSKSRRHFKLIFLSKHTYDIL